MRGVAHISFEGGSSFLPAKTPYEHEVLFDFLDQTTKRHGRTRLALNEHGWTISYTGPQRKRCASCCGRLDTLTYRHGNQALCSDCARRDIVG